VVDDTLVRQNGLTLAFGGRDVQRDGTLQYKRTLLKLHDIPEG
jgi:hypothetical protein